ADRFLRSRGNKTRSSKGVLDSSDKTLLHIWPAIRAYNNLAPDGNSTYGHNALTLPGFSRDSGNARSDSVISVGRSRASHQSTSRGSLPVGLPELSSVIFSTRASACRSNSSQRFLSASPRS